MHYSYVKSERKLTTSSSGSQFFKFLPLVFLVFGSFLLASATVPILAYQFFETPRFTPLVKPLSDNYLSSNPTDRVLGDETSLDMTQPTNWFPSAPSRPSWPSKITSYSLSIPHLKIKDATVTIGGDNLKQSLVQYQGTALPGQFGNTVVIGHSTLPQFFNPKNYTTIFSTLPTLKDGDEILVNFDGIQYRYIITEMFEVQPDNISVLEQKYESSYLTLITCVPPGTYLRRLIVRARLQDL